MSTQNIKNDEIKFSTFINDLNSLDSIYLTPYIRFYIPCRTGVKIMPPKISISRHTPKKAAKSTEPELNLVDVLRVLLKPANYADGTVLPIVRRTDYRDSYYCSPCNRWIPKWTSCVYCGNQQPRRKPRHKRRRKKRD